jgi:CBS domain-containing protein
MKVRDIMTSEELATATLDSTLEEIANMMRDENVGAIPVLDEDDQLAGIITDRDIVVRAIAEGQDPSTCTAEEILSEQLHIIEPDADLEQAADLMARHKIRRLPVVEDGTIIGMISLGDISVKAEEDQAADALEDISEGVKPAGAKQAGSPQPQRETRGSGEERESGDGQRGKADGGKRQLANRGVAQRTGSVESQFAEPQSSGEEVAAEETRYQRQSAQPGGSRAEHAVAGRTRNQSESRQTIADELVNAEGEEEFEDQNAGGGAARQRSNQQRSTRGGQRGNVQARGTERGQSERQQGISNRSASAERKGQPKVAPARSEATAAERSRPRKRAS